MVIKHLTRLASLVALLITALFVIGTPLASAQTITPQWCNTVTLDDAKLFNQPDFTKVDNAAQALIRAEGADVRVRTYPNLGNFGNINDFEKNLVNSCQSWKSSTGMNDNLIVVSFSKTPNPGMAGIYYGSRWKPSLDANWQKVQTDTFDPLLRSGKYPDAFGNTITQLQALVDKQVHPAQAQAAPVGTTQARPAQPAGPSSPPIALFVVLAIILLGGIFCLWYFVIRPSNKQEREDSSGAQEAAKNAKARAGARVRNDYDQSFKDLEARIDSLGNRASSLVAKVNQAKNLVVSGRASYGDINDSASNPDKSGLSISQYNIVKQSYDEVIQQFTQADNLVNLVSNQLDELERNPNATLNQTSAGTGTSSGTVTPTPSVSNPTPTPASASPTPTQTDSVSSRPVDPTRRITRRGQQALDDADEAIQSADRFIRSYWYWISMATKDQLQDAYRMRQRAANADSDSELINLAEKAESEAENIRHNAVRDVRMGRDYRGYPGYYDPWGYTWYSYPTPIVIYERPAVELYIRDYPSEQQLYTTESGGGGSIGISGSENGGGGSIGTSGEGSGGSSNIGDSGQGSGGGESLYTSKPEPVSARSEPEPEPDYSSNDSDSWGSSDSRSDFDGDSGGGGDPDS